MGKKIISISVDEYLLVELDELAHRYSLSRSELVNELLREKRPYMEVIAENRFLRKENGRLKKWVRSLEEIISRNKYRLNPQPVLVDELATHRKKLQRHIAGGG